jgi:hypothetical protein
MRNMRELISVSEVSADFKRIPSRTLLGAPEGLGPYPSFDDVETASFFLSFCFFSPTGPPVQY